jgi:hypothetical protein
MVERGAKTFGKVDNMARRGAKIVRKREDSVELRRQKCRKIRGYI